MASYSLQTSATSGTKDSNGIGGGTAFNIGGINFGTDNSSASATPTDSGATSSPVSSIANTTGLSTGTIYLLIGGVAVLGVILLLVKKKR